jgi:hypothetical protein
MNKKQIIKKQVHFINKFGPSCVYILDVAITGDRNVIQKEA